MSEPIEPCPNCGGEANISSTFGGFVHCPGNRCFMTGPNDDPDGAKWNAMARAVREAADWRQRAEAAEAEVERLRELRPKLTKPARVGAGTFRAGVAADLVVQAAQRLYEYEGERAAMTPEQRAAEDERLAQIVALFVNGLPARPADGGAE